ncbi:helix-turn-helix domain-containing protein [candidate division KSB1 bacterium]|nr:helix-turn-helix domain-containing protein [candidate division KSB1 bacterium]
MNKKTFGEHLRELRKQRNLTQRELAQKAGIDFTYLSKVETSRMSPPSEKTILDIAAVLELNQDESDELLLLAKKIPSSAKNMIIENQHIQEVFRTARNSDLTEKDWQDIMYLIKDEIRKREKGT